MQRRWQARPDKCAGLLAPRRVRALLHSLTVRWSYLVSGLVLAACTTTETAAVPDPIVQSRVTRASIFPEVPGRLNILFVVDDTAAFDAHRDALETAVRDFGSQLDRSAAPERLILRVGAIAATDTAVLGPVLEDAYELDGDHVTNYRGGLGDALVAALPPARAAGALIHPLAALDQVLAARPEFFADGATRVVIVTSGDDASTTDPVALAERFRATRSERYWDFPIVITDGETPRLDAFVAQFIDAKRSTWSAGQTADLLATLTLTLSTLPYWCAPANVPDPALCNMWADDTTPDGIVQRAIPPCPTAKGTCWRFEPDEYRACPSGQRMTFEHEIASELGSVFTIECVVE